jgi:hypothetical protein
MDPTRKKSSRRGILARLFSFFHGSTGECDPLVPPPPPPPLRQFEQKNLIVYHGVATLYHIGQNHIIVVGPSPSGLQEFCKDKMAEAAPDKFQNIEIRGIL